MFKVPRSSFSSPLDSFNLTKMPGKIGLFVSAAVLFVCWLFYVPYLPKEMEDRARVYLFLSSFQFFYIYPHKIYAFFGYGNYYDTFTTWQEPIYTTGPTKSGGFGILNVTRTTIEGVPVILYQPKEMSGLYPGLVEVHGGGFVYGTADTHDHTLHDYALCTGAVGINVNYRRAPQNPHPDPFHDVLKVVVHVLRHGKQYGIDVNRVGILGDSAGANLATSVTLKLAKEKVPGSKLPPLQFQALIHPPTQALDFRTPSYIDQAKSCPHLTAKVMATFYALYMGLGESNGNHASEVLLENRHVCPELRENATYLKYVSVKNLPERFRVPKRKPKAVTKPCDREIFNKIKDKITNPYVSPLLAPDLTGLPPTMVVPAQFDVLRDDGLLYAHRLKEAGVDTTLHIAKGIHGDILKGFPEWMHPTTALETDRVVCEFINKHWKT